MDQPTRNRALTPDGHRLARWKLEHGNAEASAFLHQVDLAEVTSWKCPCGCASINFQIKGWPLPPPGVNILGDYLVGEGDEVSGAFIFESGGLLSGIEFYSLGELQHLPSIEEPRPYEDARRARVSRFRPEAAISKVSVAFPTLVPE